ncbi:aminotransferase class I/II-fold pyridoxal phosphate-dependent enzyme [Salisediminibacterium beveridgei]|uniref:Aminotransferase n=1 Tax=Salisediminibacterium beveridgei TaxID=632773 RepID=A0A1D7QV47_9BACI|nr:aminotransferase class I/II-fold pyridoxal phosphate-dependent enzyme [Salisediminibacterium beveridgei]AOM82890.1 Putative aminotransferase A [Salisediminibacterium beveridgei]
MANYIGERAKSLQISGIRQFFNRVQQYPDAIQLTLGMPDFKTPEHIKRAASEAIQNNHTTYTPNAGILSLRKAVSDFLHEKYKLIYDPYNEVIITNGASQAIDTALRTILNPGDEVLIPAPVYPAYAPVIEMAGGYPVFIDTRNTGFKLTVSQIQAHESNRTKAVILPYPSNPTGVVLSKTELGTLASYLAEKPYFVLADEIYSELNASGVHHSIANEPGMRKQTIVINGVSKSHAMTGWRIGFLMAPAEIASEMLKVHQYNVSCASSVSQHAALAAMTNGKNDANEMRMAYDERRDFIIRRLQDLNIPVTKPDGAFYAFPSISGTGLSSMDFALKLLEEERLAVVPGDAFSHLGEGYIRLSYAYHMDELNEGMRRLQAFWSRIKR